MKRQLITCGLLATSVLPVVVEAVPVKAQEPRRDVTVKESEKFVKHIGELKDNTNYLVEGTLGGSSDKQDEFSFDVYKEGFYKLDFDAIRGFFQTQKVTLIGNNGFRVTGQSGLSSILKPDAYVLMIEGETRGDEFISYRAKITTPEPKNRTVTLEIKSAEALDTFDSGTSTQRKADFYVQTKINGVKKSTTSVKGNNNNPVFNYKATQSVPGSLEFIPLTVVLRDEDRFSKDDLADINPSSRNKGVNIKYFPATGEIINESDNRPLHRNPRNPDFFSIQGNNGPRAKLQLRIDHTNR